MLRKFKVVEKSKRVYPEVDIKLPKRATKMSAGYDIYTPISFTLPAWSVGNLIQTDVCVEMESDEVLMIHIRSGLGIKNNVFLINSTGIVDSDYINADNGGNIGFKLINMSDKDVEFKAGDRICQGVFVKYLVTDDDSADGERSGGYGSTGK